MVREYGQSLFLAFFIAAIGAMNLVAHNIITGYLSFAIWAAFFGTFYALPVSCQFSAICEFADVKYMNEILSINSLMLIIGSPLSPLINGALVDITDSYWSTYYFAGALMMTGAASLLIGKLEQNRRDRIK